MSLQTIIIGLLVLIAIIYVARKVYRISNGKSGCSGGSCSSGCSSGCHRGEEVNNRDDLLK